MIFFFFFDLARRDISDLSVLEVAQCAFISNQHGKQTLTDLFPFFHFCSCSLLFSLSNYGKTHCTNILVPLVGLYVHLQHLRSHTREQTHFQTNVHKMMLTIDSCSNCRKLKDTVPSQFTETTNGFLAAPWNQAAVMSMHQQWEEGEPSP